MERERGGVGYAMVQGIGGKGVVSELGGGAVGWTVARKRRERKRERGLGGTVQLRKKRVEKKRKAVK